MRCLLTMADGALGFEPAAQGLRLCLYTLCSKRTAKAEAACSRIRLVGPTRSLLQHCEQGTKCVRGSARPSCITCSARPQQPCDRACSTRLPCCVSCTSYCLHIVAARLQLPDCSLLIQRALQQSRCFMPPSAACSTTWHFTRPRLLLTYCFLTCTAHQLREHAAQVTAQSYTLVECLPLQHGDHKCCGLARASPRHAHHILTLQYQWQGLALYGRWQPVPLPLDAPQHFHAQPQCLCRAQGCAWECLRQLINFAANSFAVSALPAA